MKTYMLNHCPWRGAPRAVCQVDIHTHPRGTVVVLTEPADNPGMSVTNAVESIATTVLAMDGLDLARTLWIEHYPDRHPPGCEHDKMFDETHDLVSFTWQADGKGNLTARHPVWKRIDPEVVFGLTAGWLWVDDLEVEADTEDEEAEADEPEDAHLEAAYEDRYGYPDSEFEEQYENAYLDDYPPGCDDAMALDWDEW